MVLHLGQENDVAFTQRVSAPGLRHQIDALGCPASEDDLVRAGRAQVFGHALPRMFVGGRRARTQFMQAAMHIGVVMLIVMAKRIDDRTRLLGRGGVIEINKRMTMRLFVQNRKIFANDIPIQFATARSLHGVICSPRRWALLDSEVNKILDG